MTHCSNEVPVLKPKTKQLNAILADDISVRPIDWLWPNRMAKGKITLIGGNPGLGKSLITVGMAATVTANIGWPDNTTCVEGGVILISAEDDASDTIVPRLKAAKANLWRIHIVNSVTDYDKSGKEYRRPLNLKIDINVIENTLNRIGDISLIVVDPVSAFIEGIDSHNNAEVRGLLFKIKELAEKCDVAVVFVTHLNKNTASSDALSRMSGSGAFAAVARSVYLVAEDPEDKMKCLFLPAKNNIGPDKKGLRYKVTPPTVLDSSGDIKISTVKISWDNGAVDISADEAVPSSNVHQTDKQLAREWLSAFMDGKPKKANIVLAAASNAGFKQHTIKRAKNDLKFVSEKSNEFGGCWVWFPPNESPP